MRRQVLRALDAAQMAPSPVLSLQQLGCSVVAMQRPGHYYPLFSNSIGSDVVVAVYPG